ncbi:hypothetical protein NQ315_013778 [Exocentrus adspersus]|uniref:Dynein heavy chain tail domain-containing protein n=1 Tax=Exocentrus adspersus TaxID=1586481 RepID=A0AAV8W4C8_9CUCU|nr:hypothetical protein NQ315_013778 [Exocentrus adspersus]
MEKVVLGTIMAKQFLDPTTLFHSDIDEAMQRVGLCITTLKRFNRIFIIYKSNLKRFFRNEAIETWNFHPVMIFGRLIGFLRRLETIQWFFHTVLEFNKLQKVEIGGIKGRLLSARIVRVFEEFQQCFSTFSGKSYDVLDPDDTSFITEFEQFKQKILEMDTKLAAILCQAFEDCSNLESIFKVSHL